MKKKNHVRTIWISDVHLGIKNCQANGLLNFLDHYSCERLYLVGDLIDMWKLRRKPSGWTQGHTDVLRKILSKAKKGTEVIYVAGNHDEHLRRYIGLDLGGNISLVEEIDHFTADGRQLWVIHGDQFDMAVKHQKLISAIGGVGYALLFRANSVVNFFRKRYGFGYWSLSQCVKDKVKDVVNYVGRYEAILSEECKRQKYDGVICGHVHSATYKNLNGIQYWNCGDWVESCTAIIEEMSGAMQIVRWTEVQGVEVGHNAAVLNSFVPKSRVTGSL